MNNQYNTMVEALEELKKRGFSQNMTVNENGKLALTDGKTFSPDEVTLVEYHRFEGETNPSDSSIVYAVETNSGAKGAVVDSYGADASETTSKFMNKVKQ
jgi:hypothetical protein